MHACTHSAVKIEMRPSKHDPSNGIVKAAGDWQQLQPSRTGDLLEYITIPLNATNTPTGMTVTNSGKEENAP